MDANNIMAVNQNLYSKNEWVFYFWNHAAELYSAGRY